MRRGLERLALGVGVPHALLGQRLAVHRVEAVEVAPEPAAAFPGREARGVPPLAEDEVDAHVAALVRLLERHVEREDGDERGGSEYNLALGQKRADAVRKSLSILGVADSQMEAVSFGKEKPKASGHDEAAWTENRRADIVYSAN